MRLSLAVSPECTKLATIAAFLILAIPQSGATDNTDSGAGNLKSCSPRLDNSARAGRAAEFGVLQGRLERRHHIAEPLDIWPEPPTCARPRPKRIPARLAVDFSVPLKGKVSVLEDGTRLDALVDRQLFESSLARLIPETATVDMSDGYVRETIYKAFLRMDCLEFTALGANNHTAPHIYKPLTFGGRKIATGASPTDSDSPLLHLTIGGRVRPVMMTLPGLRATSHNVIVVTDAENVLAIDPRSADSWVLTGQRQQGNCDLRWSRLTHMRTGILPGRGAR